MKLKENSTEQKLRGGYYTPLELTEFIVQWGVKGFENQEISILEPSCGDGAFLESVNSNAVNLNYKCKAYELLEVEAEKARKKFHKDMSKIEIISGDFYHKYATDLIEEKFDLIIGNPPYIRYQYLSNDQRITQSNILVKNGLKSNKLINSWVSFIVASVEKMKPTSKLGMVIPAEIMQVAYAEDLRKFLSDQLSKITVITFEELVFPNVQQEVVVLLGEKHPDQLAEDNSINVIQLKNLSELEQNILKNEIDYKHIDHSVEKWTKYFLNTKEITLFNNVRLNPKFKAFPDIARVDIGITTGDNKYFSVNKDIVEEYDLKEVVLPLIGRSAHAKGVYYTMEDWQSNVEEGLNAHLIDFPDIPYENYSDKQKAYIKYGEENEVNKGYKCSIRNRWYRIPSIYSPDAFFLRRNNTYPKFVLNDINAVSTDTMHRIRFNEGIDHKKALLSYYNSITFAFTEIEGRSYGGGVLEVLPGEVEKLYLPDLQDMDSKLVNKLLKKIDTAIRTRANFDKTLDELDRTILVEHIGMKYDEVLIFRGMWCRLMKRRRGRK